LRRRRRRLDAIFEVRDTGDGDIRNGLTGMKILSWKREEIARNDITRGNHQLSWKLAMDDTIKSILHQRIWKLTQINEL